VISIPQQKAPSAPAPLFLVLVGIDGSGKSTALDQLSRPGLVVRRWQDLRSHEVAASLAPDAPTDIKNRATPLARAMFIGGHLVAQYEYLVRPQLEASSSVLLDSYYYKLVAKERLFGVADPSLERLCRELPQPDGVVLLEVPAATSYGRKAGKLSPYEYRGEATRGSYIAFQELLAASLRKQLRSVRHERVDAAAPADVVLERVGEAVDRLCLPARRAAVSARG
jgi:thymidylate kinase